MFDLLDKFTCNCSSEDDKAAAPAAVAVPKNEAEDSPSPEHGKNNAAAEAATLQPVDPMDAKNYLVTNLTRPMGILFEENHDARHGGAIVAEINDGYSAAADGSICRGDQLIAIGDKRVSGMDFGEVIEVIEGSEMKVKLTFFRGPAESLYGPSGASIEWLDEFVAERGEEAALVEEESESEVMPAIIADVAVIPDLLDDVAVATAAVEDACALGDSVIADQRCVDAESCDDKHVDAALVVEDEVDMNEVVECEAEVENEVDTTEDVLVVDSDVDEEAAGVATRESDEAVVVEEEADVDEGVAGEAAQEADASVLKGSIKEASEDCLDSFYAHTDSQSDSDALAAFSEKENSANTKSIFVLPGSPNGVEELK